MTLLLDRVSRTFQDGDATVHAVDDVTMHVRPGELVALYGPSGSGKTTVLLLCAGVERPDRGQVTWDGQDLALLDGRGRASWRRETLGIVPQRPLVEPGMTALEAAQLRLMTRGARQRRSEARAIATEQLLTLGLGDRLLHPVERLSGGERQRVAIARALCTDPALLLADEPTGNLDTARGEEVLHLLQNAARADGRAVLLVTHDPRASAFADRTLTLTDGRLAEQPRATRTTTRAQV